MARAAGRERHSGDAAARHPEPARRPASERHRLFPAGRPPDRRPPAHDASAGLVVGLAARGAQPAAQLGEHTAEVLREAGLSEAEIERLLPARGKTATGLTISAAAACGTAAIAVKWPANSVACGRVRCAPAVKSCLVALAAAHSAGRNAGWRRRNRAPGHLRPRAKFRASAPPVRTTASSIPVRSDGFLRIYNVRSLLWRFHRGQRRHDAACASANSHAIAELDKLTESDSSTRRSAKPASRR